MNLTRRSFLFTAASALLLPHIPLEARAAPNEAWLAWILERLTPGVLIGVSGPDSNLVGIQDLIAEVMRSRGDKLIYVSDSRAPSDMKRECMRRNLPAICRMTQRDMQYADIVVYLEGDTLTLTKHRWGPLGDVP